MPFVKRQVEPIELSRARIPSTITSKELDFITNHTLANIIHQLSSLSKHAEDLFDELYLQSEKLITRTAAVQKRVERLQGKVTQLDANIEEVSLRDINNTRGFRSSRHCQQQVVSRDTMPAALRQLYEACDPPPPLQKLNPYRTDGKDALKFYTDPAYFFELWRSQMLKETDVKQQNQLANAGAANSKHSGEKNRANRHKSPTTAVTSADAGTTSPDKQQQRDVSKTIRQPGTNRLDKYRQIAAGQDIINHVPGNVHQQQQYQNQSVQSQQQQVQNFANQQHIPQTVHYAVADHAQASHQSMQLQHQQQQHTQQQQAFSVQQVSQHQYQPLPAQTASMQQPQTQKPYPAFVVSGMAAIPPIIGALDQAAMSSSAQPQVWTSQPRSVTTTLPQLNYATNMPLGSAGAAAAAAGIFPGHTPTSASSMLVDENGRPASIEHLAMSVQQVAVSEQQQYMPPVNVSTATQAHAQQLRDVLYHTRTIPPVNSTSNMAAVPPSSLPLLISNASTTPLSQQRASAIASSTSGTSSPSRPMQPPPAPPTTAALHHSAGNVAPASPMPPPPVGEITRGAVEKQLVQQVQQQLTLNGSNAGGNIPPPPPPLPLLGGTKAAELTDAPNLPAKAGAAVAASVKSPEFPPAPPMAMREVDRRSDLLAEIRKGIALRKSGCRGSAANSATESGNLPGVDSDNVSLSSSALQNAVAGGGAKLQKNSTTIALSDVASILARRIAMRYSDTESDGEGGGGGVTGHSFDTDEWDDKE